MSHPIRLSPHVSPMPRAYNHPPEQTYALREPSRKNTCRHVKAPCTQARLPLTTSRSILATSWLHHVTSRLPLSPSRTSHAPCMRPGATLVLTHTFRPAICTTGTRPAPQPDSPAECGVWSPMTTSIMAAVRPVSMVRTPCHVTVTPAPTSPRPRRRSSPTPSML